jgi:predicted enzyme related to lactoylglutathione lyase
MEHVPPHWDAYFNVEDCDGTVARAVELGAEELVPAYDLPRVGRTATLRDPQGALLGLLQNPPDDGG